MTLSSRAVKKLPPWFKQEISDNLVRSRIAELSELGVSTVCQEANCPNLNYCFRNQKTTFLILGDACTRNCRFCAVRKAGAMDQGVSDSDEPRRIASAVDRLKLSYVVITSVTRDDLPDGGAGIYGQTINEIAALQKNIRVEVLIPDFQAKISSLKTVLAANPYCLAHNLETVKRLYPELRPKADYHSSLEILAKTKEFAPQIHTKSSLMLGLGEAENEVIEAMKDLRDARCDLLTLGQYLAPSAAHYPVKEFITLEQFNKYQAIASVLGFKSVLSGPLVRSSYKAEQLHE